MALPPDLVENRSDEREVFALINALKRQFTGIGGGAPVDANYWVSQANATLSSEVNLGALSSGILQHVVTAGVSVPGVVTVGAGLTYVSPNLGRAALTGDITAAADVNVTAFRSFAARSVLANATAGAAVPTELSSGTDGFVLRQSGTTLSFGTLGASSIPALDATFITQTPNADLANEQALSALASGMLSSVTATGVVSSTAFTTGRIAFGSGTNGTLTDSANLTFASGTLNLATASAGNVAQAFTRGGDQYIEKQGTGNFYVGTLGAQSLTFYTTNANRMSIAAGGDVSVVNLVAGGVVYATAVTGVLKIGTSAEVAGAITWPGANNVLFSTGTTTAPSGEPILQYLPTTDMLVIGEDGSLAINNLGEGDDATYERVLLSWSANTFIMGSESAGGTVRDMVIQAVTATLTLSAGGGATMVGGAVGSAPSITTANTQIEFSPIVSRARSAGATLDAVLIDGETVQITGAAGTNITTATGFNYVAIEAPTYDGGGNATTISIAATLSIAGPPVGADSATISIPLALWVQAGGTRLAGDTTVAGVGSALGFFGTSTATKQTPSGSRGGNAALASLLTALAAYGLIIDGTSA